MSHTTIDAAQRAARARSFGVTFGIIGLLAAAWLLWKDRSTAASIAGAMGSVLLLIGWMRPRWLTTPSDLWFTFAGALGWVNSRILLLATFYLVMTPMGLARRAFGHDPLQRRRGSGGWTPYPARLRERKHYDRMF